MAGKGGAERLVQLLPDAAKSRVDGWINTLTGLGDVMRDKRVQMRFRTGRLLKDQELDELYHQDDIAATAVDTFPDEALRNGYRVNIQAEDQGEGAEDQDGSAVDAVAQGEEVVRALEDFGTIEKFNAAWRWGRLFGGGGAYMVVDDGALEQSEPLNEERIRAVIGLDVVDKRDFTPHRFVGDPDSPAFGEVETYLLHRTSAAIATGSRDIGVEVHASRMIVFPGARTSRRMKRQNDGFDHSVIQRMYDVMQDFATAWGSVAHLMADANQGTFKIKGLMEMIAGGNKDVLATRMELMDMSRSVVRALMLDADGEEFTRDSPTLTGVPEVLDRFMMRMSAATGIPVTIMFGRSPAGQNATGVSDFRNFYGRVQAMQEHVLRPRLERWVRVNMLSAEGPTGGNEPERWGVEFPALWQMTPEETALIRKTIAETDEIYITSGVVDPEDVQASRFRPEGFSAETVISADEDVGPVETPEQMEARLRGEQEAAQLQSPEPSAEPSAQDPNAVDPGDALNGAQVAGMKSIVADVGARLLPRETGIEMLIASFPLSREEAEAIMGEVGRTFFVDEQDSGEPGIPAQPPEVPEEGRGIPALPEET